MIVEPQSAKRSAAKSRRRRRPKGHVTLVSESPRHGQIWRIKFDAPSTIKGERRTVRKNVRGSRKHAEEALRQLMAEAQRGVCVEDAQTVGDWVDHWLEDVRAEVSLRTWERYKQLLALHVVPYVGTTGLRDLGPAAIQSLYSRLAKSGRRSTVSANRAPATEETRTAPPGLAPRTIVHVHRVLHRCLGAAKRLKRITDNPVEDVTKPRLGGTAAASQRAAADMRILSQAEIASLLERFRSDNAPSAYAPALLAHLALDSGARRSEMLAAPWRAFSPTQRSIRFAQAVDTTREGGVQIKPAMKTRSSRRTVTLSASTVAMLAAERERQRAAQHALGKDWSEDFLIFHHPDTPDTPLNPDEVSKAWRRKVCKYGFPGLRLHDMRHTCASYLLQAGRPITEVARHLGHATPAVTMSIYSHAVPGEVAPRGLLDDVDLTAVA